MFRKLCKYEFRSLVRTLAPIYLAVIAVAVINAFMGVGSLTRGVFEGISPDHSFLRSMLGVMQTISMAAYFGVLVALSVLTLIVIIQRFYKGLLSDEGYLMFTLPVRPWQLVAAKGTAAFVMSVASTLAAFISIVILVCGAMGPAEFFGTFLNPSNWAMVFGELSRLLPLWPLYVIELIVLMIVSGLAQLYHMYVSMALGHLSGKNRIAISVVAYIAISMVLNAIGGFFMLIFGRIPFVQELAMRMETLPFAQWGNLVFNLGFIGLLVISLIQLIAFFVGTERILSKRLNLE